MRRKSREAQDTLANATAYASEQIGAVRTCRPSPTRRGRGAFSAAVEPLSARRGLDQGARSFLTFFAIFTIFSSVVAVLWFGSRDVLAGTMSPGTLGQFLLYSVFAAGALGALVGSLGRTQPGRRRRRTADRNPGREAGHRGAGRPIALPAVAKGAIEFDDVSFAYPARPDRPRAPRPSFQVKPGETVAIVGPSGAGKSTIFSLILRFYDPETGKVLIDGVDIAQGRSRALRARIAIVPQDVTIFAATRARQYRLRPAGRIQRRDRGGGDAMPMPTNSS